MEIIFRPRQHGKTVDLIKLAARDFLYIVCLSRREVERVALLAREMNLDIPYPMTYEELLARRYYGKGIKGFVIDNAEMFIQATVKDVEVKAITLTDDKN